MNEIMEIEHVKEIEVHQQQDFSGLDKQIATAREFPRMVSTARNEINSLATLDDNTAAECMFTLPRGGKPIQGPSVRLAEIILQCWGNCRAASRITRVDREEMFVEAEGVFHDLQTNSASVSTVRRSIRDKYGKLYNPDMIVVTGNAACAITKRNAILGGVPKAIWREAYENARFIVRGDVETLAERRDNAIKHMAEFGVTPELVYRAIGVNGKDDVTIDHIVTLRGIYSSINSGEATVEEIFYNPFTNPDERNAEAGFQKRLEEAKAKTEIDKPQGFNNENVQSQIQEAQQTASEPPELPSEPVEDDTPQKPEQGSPEHTLEAYKAMVDNCQTADDVRQIDDKISAEINELSDEIKKEARDYRSAKIASFPDEEQS